MMWSIPKKILIIGAVVWGLIGLILVAFIFFVGIQRRNEARVMGKDEPVLLNIVDVMVQNKKSAIVNICEDDIQVMDGGLRGNNAWSCLGRNKLTLYEYPLSWHFLSDGSGTLIHEETNSKDPGKSRMLFHVEYGNNGKIFLVYTTSEGIFGLDSIMEGMVYPHGVTAVYDSIKKEFRELPNFPKFGRLTWNVAGTQAIVHPGTCYIECSEVKLSIYDLQKDAIVFTTNESAFEHQDARNNNTGPFWSDVWWDDATHAVATLNQDNGDKRKINLNP